MNDVQRLQAMRAGDHAGRAGLPASGCPYDQGTDDGRALASAWVRAWQRAQADGTVPDVSYD